MSYNSSLMLLLTVVVVLLMVGVILFTRYNHTFKLKGAVLTGSFFGIVGALLLMHAILYWPAAEARIFAELAVLAGSSLGWLIGMWLSPMTTTETTKFAKYWTAIGVGSGFTLKWAIDHITEYKGWIASHAFVSTLFCVALVASTAAVYNTRAYNDTLVIAPRKPLPPTMTVGASVQVKLGSTAAFYAAVIGPNDPLSKWDIFPPSLGTITGEGVFTACSPGVGRITAFNIEDPSLSCSLAVEVSA